MACWLGRPGLHLGAAGHARQGGLIHRRHVNLRSGIDAWPFDAPQYLLLDIAIGGDLGGPVDNRIVPVTMAIEHVRIYRKLP